MVGRFLFVGFLYGAYALRTKSDREDDSGGESLAFSSDSDGAQNSDDFTETNRQSETEHFWTCATCKHKENPCLLHEDGKLIPVTQCFECGELRDPWICQACASKNAGILHRCAKCSELREPWECPRCTFINKKRDDCCEMCSCRSPSNGGVAAPPRLPDTVVHIPDGYNLVRQPRDGTCLFHSVCAGASDIMQCQNGNELRAEYIERVCDLWDSHEVVSALTGQGLSDNGKDGIFKDKIQRFRQRPGQPDVSVKSDRQLWRENMQKEWGDEDDVTVLSHLYNIEIQIFKLIGNDLIKEITIITPHHTAGDVRQ